MWTGKCFFIFPEYSRYVHLNNNTLAIYKVCAHAKSMGTEIFAIQGDDNIQNHWMYEHEEISQTTQSKLLRYRSFNRFIRMYDGVHVLLKDRSEVGKFFIPAVPYSKVDPDHLYGESSPAHSHHNWRYSNIQEKASR